MTAVAMSAKKFGDRDRKFVFWLCPKFQGLSIGGQLLVLLVCAVAMSPNFSHVLSNFALFCA